MGIKGIYHEIGPGDRIALSKLAVQTYEQKGRPLRLAIDISIWLFQIQSGKGGTNPALRTFFYRLLRLISLSIHPLFVFDGPNKPPFKRHKRTGPNVASIPEFLAKQLLKQFGLPFHIAPGEAEAECALLQQRGIVDAVLSEDVDTLMFGSGLTLRNWSAEGTLKTKTATHVNVYDARKTKAGSGLDRPGMILVALMSGGDYIPEGIPGCGPKTACEAARAGFGDDLYRLKNDVAGIAQWKERLVHELRTNESKFFRAKHKALVIPEDFPRRDVLRYYTDPCVSSDERQKTLQDTLKWDQDIDIPALREFVAEAFKWEFVSGAKHFIRNLAPPLLMRELRLRADRPPCDDTYIIAQEEARLIKTIHLKREHITTDNMTELRVGYVPLNLVNIDLDAEQPDPELPQDELESDDDDVPVIGEEPSSPKKKRTPTDYDPRGIEKIWVLETYVRVGVPLKIQDYEEAFRNAKRYQEMKEARKRTEGAHKKATKKTDTQASSLDRFTKVTKPGVKRPKARSKSPIEELDLAGSEGHQPPPTQPTQPLIQEPPKIDQERPKIKNPKGPTFRLPPPLPFQSPKQALLDTVDLSTSPGPQALKKQRTLRRSQSDTTAMTGTRAADDSADDVAPVGVLLDISRTPTKIAVAELSPIRELSPFVATRRTRSPLRRVKSISTTTPISYLKQPALGHLPTFHNPPILYSTVTSTNNTSVTSHKPTTPKRKCAVSRTAEVITLSSSPPVPNTPSSRERSTQNWLQSSSKPIRAVTPVSPSPRPRRVEDEVDMQAHLASLPQLPPPFERCRDPLEVAEGNIRPGCSADVLGSPMSGVTYDVNRETASKAARVQGAPRSGALVLLDGDEDSDVELPPLAALVQTVAITSTKLTLPSPLPTSATLSQAGPRAGAPATQSSLPSPPGPPISHAALSRLTPTTDPIPDPKLKRIIRIRESLPGAWAEDVIEIPSSPPDTSIHAAAGGLGIVERDGADRSEQMNTRKRPRERPIEWRVSAVEVLDLTGG